MIININDGSGNRPGLRVDLNLGTLNDLPSWSAGPRAAFRDSEDHLYAAIASAGYEGIQAEPKDFEAARRHGLAVTSSGRVDKPDEADGVTRRMKDAGAEACTLHVGTGFEEDADADAIIDAILNASAKHGYPLFVETHRATLTQDAWRTLKLVQRHPHLRLNGDFSHWYTGLEMVYGDFSRKLEILKPVFDRVGFMHGRIGNPGCMQVDVGDGNIEGRPFVEHFRQMWTASFRGFLKSAKPGDIIVFAPELLQPKIYYARTFNGKEESDRWQQAGVLSRIARECFAQATHSRT